MTRADLRRSIKTKSLCWLRAAIGSDQERKAWETMRAQKVNYHWQKKDARARP